MKIKIDWYFTGLELGIYSEIWSWSQMPNILPRRFLIVEIRALVFHAKIFVPISFLRTLQSP